VLTNHPLLRIILQCVSDFQPRILFLLSRNTQYYTNTWDNGFLKFALRALRRILPRHRQRASRMNQNRRMQCNRQGAFAQDLAAPSARSFAHGIPHEITKASFKRKALRHFLLENQMSHASHASHTSHQQAEGKARSTTNKQKAKREAHRTHPPTTTKHNKKGKLK